MVLYVKYQNRHQFETIASMEVPSIFLSSTFRTCTESCHIKDLNIKKGVMVFVPTHYIHHNPELWPNPEEFNPER